MFLDRAPELPGAIGRIVALLDEEVLGGLGEHQLDTPLGELLVDPRVASRMIDLMWAADREWKTTISSIRLRNSGRNARFISSITRSFIFS